MGVHVQSLTTKYGRAFFIGSFRTVHKNCILSLTNLSHLPTAFKLVVRHQLSYVFLFSWGQAFLFIKIVPSLFVALLILLKLSHLTSSLQGRECDVYLASCSSSPCLNQATCTNLPNSFNCTCAPGYVGATCADLIESNPSTGRGDQDKTPFIGGATAGGVIILIILLVIIAGVLYQKRRKRKIVSRPLPEPEGLSNPAYEYISGEEISAGYVSTQMGKSHDVHVTSENHVTCM